MRLVKPLRFANRGAFIVFDAGTKATEVPDRNFADHEPDAGERAALAATRRRLGDQWRLVVLGGRVRCVEAGDVA